MKKDDRHPIQVAYERRNRDLDPQLVWRGKNEQDGSNLVIQAPPLFLQERVNPKVLIDNLLGRTREREPLRALDLFANADRRPGDTARIEFYQHGANWSNRMILGDSLQVMASLAEREGLRGQVQCIYLDPPYGIKFNSNFQWSTTSRDIKDGRSDHITREPEQVKAFRDTWRDGVHSYLTYLRDRLTAARDLLSDSGSIFVQIGDENVHRVRAVLDEIFGEGNFVSEIIAQKTGGFNADTIPNTNDYVLWYSRNRTTLKFRRLFESVDRSVAKGDYQWITDRFGFARGLTAEEKRGERAVPEGMALYQPTSLTSQGASREARKFQYQGRSYSIPDNQHWKTTENGLRRLGMCGRLHKARNSLRYVRLADDFPVRPRTNTWTDTATGNFTDDKVYVVQTSTKIVERCVLMCSDPGDLVLDPTCGSGTTAYVAELWGRRWVTIDTSRVALTLARARLMGARFPYYVLTDTPDGQLKEAEVSQAEPATAATRGDVRLGFVYQRVPHITLKAIANNREVEILWDKFQKELQPLRARLNAACGVTWEEWDIPREAGDDWPSDVKRLHAKWWRRRISRQEGMDSAIVAMADFEPLYDRPYEDKTKTRVAGPFTFESLSPHRILAVDEDEERLGGVVKKKRGGRHHWDFATTILDHLKTAGVQQAYKEGRMVFSSLVPWPGELVCGEGRYVEPDGVTADFLGSPEKRAAIFIGPEFGTVSRHDLIEAVREAVEANFDVLIACGFNFDACASEFKRLGRIPVVKARMNADLHMAADLKNTGKGNLFVVFGEPDIDIRPADSSDAEPGQIQVKINGIDVFHPNSGEIRSDGTAGIACWFIDTDYDEESFFVRHAYFLGANDPYKNLKITLRSEINEEAWKTLHSDVSHPFDKPKRGCIAVKVINHLGDEVMKVFRM